MVGNGGYEGGDSLVKVSRKASNLSNGLLEGGFNGGVDGEVYSGVNGGVGVRLHGALAVCNGVGSDNHDLNSSSVQVDDASSNSSSSGGVAIGAGRNGGGDGGGGGAARNPESVHCSLEALLKHQGKLITWLLRTSDDVTFRG